MWGYKQGSGGRGRRAPKGRSARAPEVIIIQVPANGRVSGSVIKKRYPRKGRR